MPNHPLPPKKKDKKRKEKKTTLSHIIRKLQKIEDKEKLLKEAREGK